MSMRRISAALLLYLLIPAAIALIVRFAPRMLDGPTPYALDAASYERAWIDLTDPDDPCADPPRYTEDPALIADIVTYLNNLELRARTDMDVQSGGRRARIELVDDDTGATSGFRMRGNASIEQDGGDAYIMRLYLSARSLERDVYPRMREASTMRGAVRDVGVDGDVTALTIALDLDDGAVYGPTDPNDATYEPNTMALSLPTERVYRDGTPGAFLVPGEPVICYFVDRKIGEVTLCDIWRVVALSRVPPDPGPRAGGGA